MLHLPPPSALAGRGDLPPQRRERGGATGGDDPGDAAQCQPSRGEFRQPLKNVTLIADKRGPAMARERNLANTPAERIARLSRFTFRSELCHAL
jgi:hypothetical protein